MCLRVTAICASLHPPRRNAVLSSSPLPSSPLLSSPPLASLIFLFLEKRLHRSFWHTALFKNCCGMLDFSAPVQAFEHSWVFSWGTNGVFLQVCGMYTAAWLKERANHLVFITVENSQSVSTPVLQRQGGRNGTCKSSACTGTAGIPPVISAGLI